MNRKIARMRKEIERRGGVIGMSDRLPDDIAEFFLAEILDCPDCCEAAKSGVTVADDPRPNASRRRKSKSH